MITLYFRPKTSGRPMRAAWLLEELGAEYEAIPVPDTDAPEHTQRNPLGRVPVVRFDDDSVLFDSTAILFAIADRHPDSGVIGPLGSRERDLVYQWSLTAQTELEPAAIAPFRGHEDDDSRAVFATAAAALDEALGDRDFLVGDTLTVADIVTVGVLFIGQRSGYVTELTPPKVQRYFAAVGGRPALARAAQRTESIMQPEELLGRGPE